MDFSETDAPARMPGEPSVTSALEHLVRSSQGVITKRIDLALLEGCELLWRSVERAMLVGMGIALATTAWLAAAGSLVLLVAPEDARPALHLAAFGLLNGLVAVALITLARRYRRASTTGHPKSTEQFPAWAKN